MGSSTFTVSQIAAISENFALGKDNRLLWHFSEDLKFFKSMTQNKVMIMGRKTFQSFPKPLPGRHHVVISRSTMESTSELVHFVTSIDGAFEKAKELVRRFNLGSELMVCGGAEIYKETLSQSDFLYLTRIKGTFEADAFYPNPFHMNFALSMSRKSELHPGQFVWETWSKTQSFA